MQTKAKTKTDGIPVMLAASPGATAGFLIFSSEIVWKYGLIAVNAKSYEAFQLDILSIITMVLNFGLVVYLYRQKHTYQSQSPFKNILLSSLFFILSKIIGPIIFYGIMLFLTGLFFTMPAMLLTKLTSFLAHSVTPSGYAKFMHQAGCLIAGAFAVYTILTGISALSRSFRLWAARDYLKNIATSKTKSAAMGVVELRGTAHPGPNMESGPHIPVLGTNPPYFHGFMQQPFLLRDEKGSLLVDPGDDFDSFNPRLFLDLGKEHGLPVLMPGDQVYVLGELQTGAQETLVVGPWYPPFGLLYKKFRSRLGSLGQRLRLLDSSDILIISGGDEIAARDKLFRSRYRWFAFGIYCLFGGAVTAAIALGVLMGESFLATPDLSILLNR